MFRSIRHSSFLLIFCSVGIGACGTSSQKIEKSDAVVSLDHPRFTSASSEFTISRDRFTGQATHSAKYEANDSLAHLLVLVAGSREYIGKIKKDEDVNQWCEITFFKQDENVTQTQLPLWSNSGILNASFGEVRYRKLAIGDRDCACFLHGWGRRGGVAYDGNSRLLLGYVCNNSQNLARTEIESLINAIELRKR